MPRGHVTHAERDGVHVLRYFGRVDYTSAPALHGFLDDLLQKHDCRGLIFDLGSAESLDSTNFGLIARVAEGWRTTTGAPSLVVSTNDDVTSVLRSMCLDEVVELVETRPEDASSPLASVAAGAKASANTNGTAASESVIPPGRPSTDDLRRTMLDAHRALMKLSESGRLAFQDVVAGLEGES